MNQQQTTSLSKLIRVNEEAERLVVGTLLSIPNSMLNLCDGFCADFFYDSFFAETFRAISQLDSENAKIDVLTVSERLRRNKVQFDIADFFKLADTQTFNIEPHSLMVKEKAIERGVLSLVHESSLKIAENNDIGDVLYNIGEQSTKLQESLVGGEQSKHISVAVAESIERLNKRIENREKGFIPGVPTGLSDVNKHTSGWQKQDLIVIAARPGMGKTALALTMAEAAAKHETPVCIFSLEMGKSQLTDRLLVGESGILSDAYKAGIIQPEQFANLTKATNLVASLPIYIDDKPTMSISYVRSRARILHKQGKCELIIIDYLQLMEGTKEQRGNREQEIASISRGCKGIAKELDIPVILLSQLNRKVEDRADKRPMLQDLRESGAIEQDADIVLFINRPKQYGQECKDSDGNVLNNGMELIFAKFRNGSPGILFAQHNDSLTRLYDINTRQYEESTFNAPRSFSEPKKSEQDDLPF